MGRGFALVFFMFFPVVAQAQGLWQHNGSEVELSVSGSSREFSYVTPRSGLPVSNGDVLFKGTRSGSSYSGTAYLFSKECGSIGYPVKGTIRDSGNYSQTIRMKGKAPKRDASCEVIGHTDSTLVFEPSDEAGCDSGFDPGGDSTTASNSYQENSEAGEGTSCPYLYARSPGSSVWQAYGKVIHAAVGQSREMTEVIRLKELATSFRLAEEEPEIAFIDHVELRLELTNGTQLALSPKTLQLARRDQLRLKIPAYKSVQFQFRLPSIIKPRDVLTSSLAITGYYERLPFKDRCVPRRSR